VTALQLYVDVAPCRINTIAAPDQPVVQEDDGREQRDKNNQENVHAINRTTCRSGPCPRSRRPGSTYKPIDWHNVLSVRGAPTSIPEGDKHLEDIRVQLVQRLFTQQRTDANVRKLVIIDC